MAISCSRHTMGYGPSRLFTPRRFIPRSGMAPRKRARTDAASSSAPSAPGIDHTAPLSAGSFASLYDAGELLDGEVLHKGTTHPVSCLALAAASSFCKAAFCRWQTPGANPRVSLDDAHSSACVAALLRYAHTGTLTVPDSEAEGLLVAADQLGFPGLVPVAAKHLAKTLSPATCLSRLALATRHSADALGEAAIKLAGEHWAAVASSPAFLALDRDALALLLGSDHLVAKETEVYEALLAWHGANGGDFAPLLELIRLSELGLTYLIKNVIHAAVVKASPHAETLVQEAALYLGAAPAERAALASARTRPRVGKGMITADDPVRVEGNTLVVGRVAFRVGPEGAPEAEHASHDQSPFRLLPGEQIVSCTDPDWEVVRTKVIAPHDWSTNVVAVRKGAADCEGFTGYWTKHADVVAQATLPGDEWATLRAMVRINVTDTTCTVSNAGVRLLLRRQA